MVLDNQENAKLCTCPQCPSYNDCMKGKNETLYCARDKSACEVQSKGCICPQCPVYLANGLSGMYFCLNGKAV